MSEEETEQDKEVRVKFADVEDDESEDQIEEKSWVVEVTPARSGKPFLGGFRNRKTGIEYHHAATQTFKANLSKVTMNI